MSDSKHRMQETQPWAVLVRSNDYRALEAAHSQQLNRIGPPTVGPLRFDPALIGKPPCARIAHSGLHGLSHPLLWFSRGSMQRRPRFSLFPRGSRAAETHRIWTADRMRLQPAEKRVTNALSGTKSISGSRAHQRHPTFLPVRPSLARNTYRGISKSSPCGFCGP